MSTSPKGRHKDSLNFVIKKYIGTVSATNYARIESAVNGVDPPEKQFDRATRINPQEPLRRCQKWTAEAIQALRESNVLGLGQSGLLLSFLYRLGHGLGREGKGREGFRGLG